jgi:hypothetical protein
MLPMKWVNWVRSTEREKIADLKKQRDEAKAKLALFLEGAQMFRNPEAHRAWRPGTW